MEGGEKDEARSDGRRAADELRSAEADDEHADEGGGVRRLVRCWGAGRWMVSHDGSQQYGRVVKRRRLRVMRVTRGVRVLRGRGRTSPHPANHELRELRRRGRRRVEGVGVSVLILMLVLMLMMLLLVRLLLLHECMVRGRGRRWVEVRVVEVDVMGRGHEVVVGETRREGGSSHHSMDDQRG